METTKYRSIEVGDRVTGTYCDVPVTGTVIDTRGHTINWNATVCRVEVDEPFEYGRTLRTEVMFQVDRIGDDEWADNYGSRISHEVTA